VCFSRAVKLAAEHVEQFRAAGIRAALLTGETPLEERRRHLADLRDGRINVLCNVFVATEGFDIPAVDCIILARGIGSTGGYLQMVGRALRPAPGKLDAIILDLAGVSEEHGHPEDERSYSLSGRGISSSRADDQAYCRVCSAPVERGETCIECGIEPGSLDLEDKVTHDKLFKFAEKRKEPDAERARTLSRWLAQGERCGYKRGWAYNKYRAVYGALPTGAVYAALESLRA
jgi:superfamily II DNA or RNA helicase